MPKSSSIPSASLKHWSEVKAFLVECGLSQYYDTFVSEGFDRVSTVLDITENDLIEMNIKRGHRRLLQRHVATCKGHPTSQPLYHLHQYHEDYSDNLAPPPQHSPLSSCSSPRHRPQFADILNRNAASSTEEEDEYTTTVRHDVIINEDAGSGSGKRQYRRHPKADLNAPIKPASGYVMFANALRDNIKEKKLSFADIAKVVGERWKQIGADEKFYWEDTAAKAKQEYLKQVAEYKKTDSYNHYQEYLRQFEQQGSDRALGRPRLRRGMRNQRGHSPSVGNFGGSSGTESVFSQPNTSIPPPPAETTRTWESLTRSSSGESISQPYRTLSVVHRQSSIRGHDERPKANRETSQKSSTSNASTESTESTSVPSLEREANRY
ncbi:unnamed protein product [Umbelopsis ramanniana]